uniref:Uncharacterized protein n=1 Tax=Utricularia reniformis TaxID=192314 RepID=A0A1Y0B3X1_9LAMI|nr:hypothetical protein AEK19_MT1948 [Utricularia reniformis]ART32111.1 hypothetical protein AEK19_MT1948 [Utricularia reniformis]
MLPVQLCYSSLQRQFWCARENQYERRRLRKKDIPCLCTN